MRRSTKGVRASKKIVENGDSKALPKTDEKRKKTCQQQEQRCDDKKQRPLKRYKPSSPPATKEKSVLPNRPVKKAAPALSKEAAKRSQALVADLFGSDSSSDDDESIQDLCSTSSDADNVNGKVHAARKPRH